MIRDIFNAYCASAVFLIDRAIEKENLRDLEPNAVTKKMQGYVSHAYQSIKESEKIVPRLAEARTWQDVANMFDNFYYDSTNNELIFETDNFRGTIFKTEDNRFVMDHNIIVLNKEGNIFKTLFPDGEEIEFDINKYYEYEKEYQKELENSNNQETCR